MVVYSFIELCSVQEANDIWHTDGGRRVGKRLVIEMPLSILVSYQPMFQWIVIKNAAVNCNVCASASELLKDSTFEFLGGKNTFLEIVLEAED